MSVLKSWALSYFPVIYGRLPLRSQLQSHINDRSTSYDCFSSVSSTFLVLFLEKPLLCNPLWLVDSRDPFHNFLLSRLQYSFFVFKST